MYSLEMVGVEFVSEFMWILIILYHSFLFGVSLGFCCVSDTNGTNCKGCMTIGWNSKYQVRYILLWRIWDLLFKYFSLVSEIMTNRIISYQNFKIITCHYLFNLIYFEIFDCLRIIFWLTSDDLDWFQFHNLPITIQGYHWDTVGIFLKIARNCLFILELIILN